MHVFGGSHFVNMPCIGKRKVAVDLYKDFRVIQVQHFSVDWPFLPLGHWGIHLPFIVTFYLYAYFMVVNVQSQAEKLWGRMRRIWTGSAFPTVDWWPWTREVIIKLQRTLTEIRGPRWTENINMFVGF